MRRQAAAPTGIRASDTIEFAISGTGPHAIQPLSPLPDVNQSGFEPAIIDASTQTGASCPDGPQIVIDGSMAGTFADGLSLRDGNTVRGLVIQGFSQGVGILIYGIGNTIECNLLGTDAAGTGAVANLIGVDIELADDNVVGSGSGGDADAAERNLISGNTLTGVQINGDGSVVRGNYIGTDLSGAQAVANGIGVTLGLADVEIGVSGRPPVANSALVRDNFIAFNGVGLLVAGGEIDVGLAPDSRDNCISGNQSGAEDPSMLPVTFENNWWGDASGPRGDGPGSGDSVGTDIDYDPFLTAPAAICARASIVLTKTAKASEVVDGETASFTITVSNPSSTTKTQVSVSDPLTPACEFALPSLASGALSTHVCQTGALTADFTNIATVSAVTGAGATASATAAASVNVINPIEIVKGPLEQQIAAGDGAAFTITLLNDEDNVKTNIAVLDPLTPDCSRAAGTLPDLQPRTSLSYTCATGPLTQDLVNMATVTATGPGGQVMATASAFVDVVEPTLCVSGQTATGTGEAQLCLSGGGTGCSFTEVHFIPLEGGPLSPSPGTAPAGVSLQHGLVAFGIGESCEPGFTAHLTPTLPSALPPGTMYWNYGPMPDEPTPHWYTLPASVAGNVVSFSITDGGLGDQDLTADGSIRDPSGPGVPPGAGIPTLSPWSLAVLVSLSALLGSLLARRRAG